MWLNPYFQFALFSTLYFVFFLIAASAILGIRDNYRRHYQKADLQWTGRQSRFSRQSGRLQPLVWLALSLALSALTVRFAF